MSISSITGGQAATLSLLTASSGNAAANATAIMGSVAGGSDASAVLANVELASSSVSEALQALGSIIDVTA